MLVSPSRWWWWCLRVPKNALLVVVIDARESRLLSFWLFLSREVLREYSFTQNSTARRLLSIRREKRLFVVPLISLSRMLLLLRRRRRRLRRLLAHTPLNTLLDSRAKKLTLSLFDKAFFVFFFSSSSSLLAAGSSFFLSTTQSFAFEKERSLQHTYILLSLSLFCVCVYSTTHDFYTTTKKGRRGRDKKRDPPPKKKTTRCA